MKIRKRVIPVLISALLFSSASFTWSGSSKKESLAVRHAVLERNLEAMLHHWGVGEVKPRHLKILSMVVICFLSRVLSKHS